MMCVRFLGLLGMMLICQSAYSQVYSLNQGFLSGGTVTTCTGLFKDSNPFGAYNRNENYTVTFTPGSATGQAIQLNFDTLSLVQGDTLKIFDGTSTTSPLLQAFTSVSVREAVRATTLNPGGSLTILFTSAQVSEGNASGWNAVIACRNACQPVGVMLTSRPAADADGYINVCNGAQIIFSGAGIYNENDKNYHQSDSTSTFFWTTSDGNDTTGIFVKNFKLTVTKQTGTIVQLAMEDPNGCYSRNTAIIKIRPAITPLFGFKDTSLCLYDTADIIARPTLTKGSFTSLPVYAKESILKDSAGVCYETAINITRFAPGQTLTNINDLQGILVNMEHSWFGDITIAIRAPNNTRVFLKKSVGGTNNSGWETFLGEPVDEQNNTSLLYVPGKGYDYTFSTNGTYNNMIVEKGKYRYNYTDNAGQRIVNHTYLPSGGYQPEESLTALLGTPLNGIWTIEVCDNYAEDNGYIFYWTIQFNPALFSSPETYNTTIQQQQWITAPGLLSTRDSAALISPVAAGNYAYTYRLTDNFGCQFDTTLNITVNPLAAKPALGRDTVLCIGTSLTLKVNNPLPDTYTWSTGESGNNISINQAGTYLVDARNGFGCHASDTITVVNSLPASLSIQSNNIYCATQINVLTATTTGNIDAYQWSTGQTSDTINAAAAGTYSLSASTTDGCTISDTVILIASSVNNFRLPADTTVCVNTNFALALNVPAGAVLTWSDGSTNSNRSLDAGVYQITANVDGCTITDEIVVGTRPVPVINLGPDTTICTGFDIRLSVAYPGAAYRWSTGSTDNDISVKNSALYWAEATLNTCTYRDSLNLALQNCDCNVRMPNAFSPNGDGINDAYRPEILCFPVDYSLSIFNRYGQLVHTSREWNKPWDGNVNGTPATVGVYYYILRFYNTGLSKQEQFTGSITLLR